MDSLIRASRVVLLLIKIRINLIITVEFFRFAKGGEENPHPRWKGLKYFLYDVP